jgi:CxxC motif-containing protein (DUF1111 family)
LFLQINPQGGKVIKTRRFAFCSASAMIFLAGIAVAQTDPGVQSGSRTGTFAGITVHPGTTLINPNDDPNGFTAFFADGLSRFQEIEDVSTNNNPNVVNVGLGPRFNFNQCAGCHAQPAVGGTGAAVNPQFAAFGSCANEGDLSVTNVSTVTSGQSLPTPPQRGTIICNNTNTVPSFITANGPTREARFPFLMNANGTVNTTTPSTEAPEDLFTVAGRPDAGTCTSLAQPNFTAAENAGNVIFRIPTPLFGLGLVENLDDSTLLINRNTNLSNSFGIAGSFNRSGNDGTITKFGWKAQNKSLHIFAGEAYNVEMGITNLLQTNEKPDPEEEMLGTGLPASCLNLSGTGYPEDTSNPLSTPNSAVLDDVSAFANFVRFLAPPPTGSVVLSGATVSASTLASGLYYFNGLGCATCHNATPGTTQRSSLVPALSNQPVPAFSDFELHHMGTGLADNISQGSAGGDEFRTAPLWGLGQRIFLLHDGRTTNLITAIMDHESDGSEANTVVENYLNLSAAHQQDLLDYLRSL